MEGLHMPDRAFYEKLAAASSPEEVEAVFDKDGVKAEYVDGPPAPADEAASDLPPEMGEDGPPEMGGDDEVPYDDDSGMPPETGRRAGILMSIRKHSGKNKPEDEEGAE